MFMLGIQPPSIQMEAAAFDFESYRNARIHPGSDPALVGSLARLCRDSKGFREMLGRFAAEEPAVRILLLPTEERSFGGIVIRKVESGYVVTLLVQTKLSKIGVDAVEPWLGGILFGLREVSQGKGIVQQTEASYNFNVELERRIFLFQKQLRTELKDAGTEPQLRLSPNWRKMYRLFVLRTYDGD